MIEAILFVNKKVFFNSGKDSEPEGEGFGPLPYKMLYPVMTAVMDNARGKPVFRSQEFRTSPQG